MSTCDGFNQLNEKGILKTMLGLSVSERQVKLSATTSIPEFFGTQFVRVLRNPSVHSKQYDPLEFVVFFNALRQMELHQMVNML